MDNLFEEIQLLYLRAASNLDTVKKRVWNVVYYNLATDGLIFILYRSFTERKTKPVPCWRSAIVDSNNFNISWLVIVLTIVAVSITVLFIINIISNTNTLKRYREKIFPIEKQLKKILDEEHKSLFRLAYPETKHKREKCLRCGYILISILGCIGIIAFMVLK